MFSLGFEKVATPEEGRYNNQRIEVRRPEDAADDANDARNGLPLQPEPQYREPHKKAPSNPNAYAEDFAKKQSRLAKSKDKIKNNAEAV